MYKKYFFTTGEAIDMKSLIVKIIGSKWMLYDGS